MSSSLRVSMLLSGGIAVIVWLCWAWAIYPVTPVAYIAEYWQITLTMAFGSFIAGATSEGGGAVAFPVFTKVLSIAPTDAKVFSLAIQSVGMTAASLVIICLRVTVAWRAIFWAGLGGIPGVCFGAAILAPLLPAPVVKMSFTLMLTSFAVILYMINRYERDCRHMLDVCGAQERCILLLVGCLGGVMSGLVGNGIDIFTFSILVLLFRVSEKVATPTSVILMAINAIMGFALHYFLIGGFTPQVQAYWLAAIPIVVVGAPIGAMVCSRLDRRLIARILMGLIGIELISSLLLIPLNISLVMIGAVTFVIFLSIFYYLARSEYYSTIDGSIVLAKEN